MFIKLNVPSSKNSKQWTGKYLVWSKKALQYVKATEPSWIQYKDEFKELIKDKEFPLQVAFTFVRQSKHKFDYVNPLQTVLDLMVRYEWIEDDNADIIIPVFKPYIYDKENPGVKIEII